MKKTLATFALLSPLLPLILMTGACARHDTTPPPRPPSVVSTATATTMDVPVMLHAFGSTGDRENVTIVPQVSGVLLKTFITDGAVVTNGQPLFHIDPSDYEARMRQAEGTLAADKAALDLDQITLQRNKPLLDKKLISPEGYDILLAKVTASAARLRVDDATLDQARLNFARCIIASPLNGVCSKRLLDGGNLVTAGLTPLINIRSYDPMDVDFSIPEQHLPALRRAMQEGKVLLQVVPQGDTNGYSGTLTFIDNAVSSQTGTILLRGQVPNPDHALWAQQFVNVTLTIGTIHNAIMVSEGAVQFGKQGAFLFAVTPDNKADRRPVKTGIRYNDLIQIMGGVAPGEKVVVLGQLTLLPGAPVLDAASLPAPTNAPKGNVKGPA